METIRLNHLNTAFRVEGSEKRKNLELHSISVQQWPASGATLKLLVIDEKDIPIYSLLLDNSRKEEEFSIQKSFGFYDHLSVQLAAEPAGSPFDALIRFS